MTTPRRGGGEQKEKVRSKETARRIGRDGRNILFLALVFTAEPDS
jgi:hypothetical protein